MKAIINPFLDEVDTDEEDDDKSVTPRFKPGSEYIKLRDEWYKRLKDGGWNDIETVAKGKYYRFPFLKSYYRERERGERLSKENYFRLAGHWLYDGKFSSTERSVWKNHAEGMTIPEILKYRSSRNLNDITRYMITKILKKLKSRMIEEYMDDDEYN